MAAYKQAILITGGTVNLGYEASLAIARQSSADTLIVIASRSDKDKAAEKINKTLHKTNVIFLPLDLGNLENVRKFASDWTAKSRPPIKALVLNAGLQFPGPVEKFENGLEKTFAINHVGHALLFHLLWQSLTKDARIVITASGTHDPAQNSGMPDAVFTTAEEMAHPDPATADKDGRVRYTSSKLANVLWLYALDRKLKQHATEKHITVTAFDPGLMPGTGLAREYSAVQRFVWNHILPHMIWLLRLVMFPNIHTPQASGQNLARLARLAVGADVEGVSGRYYEGPKEIKTSVASYDESKQDDLWSWTVRYLANGDKELEAKYDELR